MLAAVTLALLLAADPARPACPASGMVVAIFTLQRQLWLCRDGVETARIPVALGRGGSDKYRKGDGRTPLGAYALGEPRPSSRYGTFIPIRYPTEDQARRGHSGESLGIHGPPRGQAEPDYPTTAVDWTLGCIATGTDADVEAVAAFVRRYGPTVLIR
ncbi:MAG: L,D-transpeptidase family protein [Deltaproteobacteria bacterium]